jgi:hypothetical protein
MEPIKDPIINRLLDLMLDLILIKRMKPDLAKKYLFLIVWVKISYSLTKISITKIQGVAIL